MVKPGQLHRPRLGGFHYCLFDPDGKQHDMVTASLLGESLADLVLHPIAGNSVLREDQQQLVAHPNGFIDCVLRLRDRQVVQCKPAPTPLFCRSAARAGSRSAGRAGRSRAKRPRASGPTAAGCGDRRCSAPSACRRQGHVQKGNLLGLAVASPSNK
jgi:hypothetical protein